MIEFEREWHGSGVPFQVRTSDIVSFWPLDAERTIVEVRQMGRVVALAPYARIKGLMQALGSLIEGDA
ncbi:MAG TPA: hypothetical protein VFB50_03455 [Chloroflexota bacterium]|nr:hypothetical protein [Chloroflexota bacterium]